MNLNLKNRIANWNIQLIISLIIAIVAFIVSRFPFYIYSPITYWCRPDTYLYFHPAFDIASGHFPKFPHITPGYPLFLAFVGLLSNKITTILFFQSLTTLIASLYFIYSVNKSYRNLTIIASIFISVFMLSSDALQFETVIMSDSFYANFLILFVSQVILALNHPNTRNFILISVFAAIAILIRPAGLFLVSIIVLISIFILIKKLSSRHLISISLPLILILLFTYFYNFFTINSFTLSAAGASYMPVSVINYMKPNPKFDKKVNEALIAIQDSIPKDYLETIRTSTNNDTLWKAYYWNNPHLQHLFWKTLVEKAGYKSFREGSTIVKKACYTTIREHPKDYFKFFKVNFIESFKNFTWERFMFYYSTVPNRFLDVYKMKTASLANCENMDLIYDDIKVTGAFKNYIFKEFIYNRNNIESGFDANYSRLKQSKLFKIYDLYYVHIHSKLFKKMLWIYFFMIIGLFSLIKFIISRFKNTESFILTIIFLIPLLSFFLNSMVEVSDRRYSFPSEFCYFISFALVFVYFKDIKKTISNLKSNN